MLIFLGAFFCVAAVVAGTLAVVAVRGILDGAPERIAAIQWHSDFSDLLSADRCCRHVLTGEIDTRECPNEFDCRRCSEHPRHAQYNGDRLYHRGHACAQWNGDGSYNVTLDDAARGVIRGPLQLPEVGSVVFVNGTAWKAGDLRVLSPVTGEVIATADGSDGWYLRVRPETGFRTDHLLRGPEVEAWERYEAERVSRLNEDPDAAARLLLNA